MDKSTLSILFIMQKGKPNAEGNAPIFARITINHQMTHLATRYYLPQLETLYFFFLIENKRFTELEFAIGNDLETSEVTISVLFCIIERMLFLSAKVQLIFVMNKSKEITFGLSPLSNL